MRAKFVLSEALTGLWRNVTMSVAMILTTAISLTLLGAGGLLYVQIQETKDVLRGKVEVMLFLNDDANEQQRQTLKQRLENDHQLVRDVSFESKEQAYERFKELFRNSPDFVHGVQPDALPASFRVKLLDPKDYSDLANKYRSADGVSRVSSQQEVVSQLFSMIDAVKNTTFAVAVLQGIAALLLIGNTIQVAAYSRRREVSIMKLVGASNWYVRLPFILEASMAGLIGAAIGWLGLILGKVFLVDGALKPIFSSGLIPIIQWSDILLTGPILAFIAIAISGITGWSTLRFYVKV
ncbi:MAG: ABC transporter permease [Acidimicrobiales bacterium]|nr:MAG: ABC transporter permease [Acidimicrobiales bacterium]